MLSYITSDFQYANLKKLFSFFLLTIRLLYHLCSDDRVIGGFPAFSSLCLMIAPKSIINAQLCNYFHIVNSSKIPIDFT